MPKSLVKKTAIYNRVSSHEQNDNLKDDVTKMKISTVRNSVNQTPLILDLAKRHEIRFLVDEIQSRIEELRNWLVRKEH